MRSLFGGKWKRRGIHLREAKKEELPRYNQLLSQSGFYPVGTPMVFRASADKETLRESALQYAQQKGYHLVVEVEDPDPVRNPFNPYKYYIFQYTGRPPAPDPPYPSSITKGAPSATQKQQSKTAMAVTCPYCNKVFEDYVTPGESNVLTCPFCGGQSVLEVPIEEGMNAQDAAAQLSHIKLKGSYDNTMEMIRDCLEALSQILIIDAPILPFKDTGEYLYPFCVIKRKAYQHIGFRDMDLILLKEAVHDYKIIGSEIHTQSQRNIAPHRDEFFAIKTLGGYTYMILEGYKEMDNKQKSDIANAFYEFLTGYISTV